MSLFNRTKFLNAFNQKFDSSRMTLVELEKKLEISATTLFHILQGSRDIKVSQFATICEFMGCSPGEFFTTAQEIAIYEQRNSRGI